MGAKSGKTTSTIETIKEQEKPVITNSNNHANGTTKQDNKFKATTLKNPKKKVNQSTNTDGGILKSLFRSKTLSNGSTYHNLSNGVRSNELDSTYKTEMPSKDVLEFREACVRRGLFSPETMKFILRMADEQDRHDKNVHESIILINKTDEQVSNQQQVPA